jgi:hypothetical protein
MSGVLRRFLIVVLGALALTACRLDVTVDVAIDPDGTGTVVVTATADAEVVDAVPGLADALVFDDAEAAGWTVEGPDETDDGGLTVTLAHDVSGPEELANVLASLGPPFVDMVAGRTTVEDTTTNAIGGTLVLTDGFATFADSDLTGAVGGLPFQEQIEASGATPQTSMSVTLRTSLPGEVLESTGVDVTPEPVEDPSGDPTDEETATVWAWEAPLDGSSREVVLQTVQRPAEVATWPGTVATIALVALIAWVAVSVLFIGWVVVARRRRARRRRRAVPPR